MASKWPDMKTMDEAQILEHVVSLRSENSILRAHNDRYRRIVLGARAAIKAAQVVLAGEDLVK